MRSGSTILAVPLLALALASVGDAATAGKVKVLATSSTTSAGNVVLGNTGIWRRGQPYVSFGFRVRAPTGQKVSVFWSVHCYSSSTTRGRTGRVGISGRGSIAVTFWRPRTLNAANYCRMTLIATRNRGLSGRLIATLLGRR
jgi:hypothetical protein